MNAVKRHPFICNKSFRNEKYKLQQSEDFWFLLRKRPLQFFENKVFTSVGVMIIIIIISIKTKCTFVRYQTNHTHLNLSNCLIITT